MRARHCHGFRRMAPGFIVALVSLVGLTGCHRGGWSDPDRTEKRVDHIVEEVEDDLDIRPEQKPAFQALAGKIKSHAIERTRAHRDTAEQLKSAFGQTPADMERAKAALKELSQKRPSTAEHDALIDEAAAFYRTLDAEQQATFNKKVRRMLDWYL